MLNLFLPYVSFTSVRQAERPEEKAGGAIGVPPLPEKPCKLFPQQRDFFA